MGRQIIKIDQDTCVGCGLCATACHLNIIEIENGKAKLLRPDVCDGLGRCLPNCPVNAITFQDREEALGMEDPINDDKKMEQPVMGGCPGSQAQTIIPVAQPNATAKANVDMPSQLAQWPVQIKLVPVNAPYFQGANLLVAADCAAFAHGNFHETFMRDKVTIIGCPKLDEGDYSEKLTEILSTNDVRSVTVIRMEVPCCSGIENAVKIALKNSGKLIPWNVVTLSINGEVIEAEI